MTDLEVQLQQSLALMRAHDAPLRLTRGQAEAQAVRLRWRGWTYSAIAKAMADYHGDYRSERAWRDVCRSRGVPAKHHANGTLRVPPQFRERVA
jgi:hypothetical protein